MLYDALVIDSVLQTDSLDGLDLSSSMSAGRILIHQTSRANFDRIIAVFNSLEVAWHGVRYIRDALLQRAEGIQQVDLVKQEQPLVDLDSILRNLPVESRQCGC